MCCILVHVLYTSTSLLHALYISVHVLYTSTYTLVCMYYKPVYMNEVQREDYPILWVLHCLHCLKEDYLLTSPSPSPSRRNPNLLISALATISHSHREGFEIYVINIVDIVCTTYFLSLSVSFPSLKLFSVLIRKLGIGKCLGNNSS